MTAPSVPRGTTDPGYETIEQELVRKAKPRPVATLDDVLLELIDIGDNVRDDVGDLGELKASIAELDLIEPINRLEGAVARLLAYDDRLSLRKVENHRADGSIVIQEKNGPAFKALVFDGIPVDLFITDPDRWGCILALRTGPGDWNVRLVMDCKRINRAVAGGRVLHLGKPVPTPEEEDFFRELGQPWLEPWERHVDRVGITWPARP